MSAGQASSLAPDYGKAKTAAAKIIELLDRQSEIDSSDPTGEQLVSITSMIPQLTLFYIILVQLYS
jgi:hypothetical protein